MKYKITQTQTSSFYNFIMMKTRGNLRDESFRVMPDEVRNPCSIQLFTTLRIQLDSQLWVQTIRALVNEI